MVRKSAFEKVKSGLEQAIAHAKGDVVLDSREVELPDPPEPMTPEEIARLRTKTLHMSQAVFARVINAAPQTVHAWEQGRAKPSGCALRFLRLLNEQPEIVNALLGGSDNPKKKVAM